MASPAAATSPVAPVSPGITCVADDHFTMRSGPNDRIYQCQNHEGWHWVPTEPCPSANDHRLLAICYPIVYPSASVSPRPPCVSAPASRPPLDLDRLRTLPPPICPSASTSPSKSPSKSASSSPSSSGTASASASGGVVVIPSDNGVGDKLPVTGSKAGKIAALGFGVAAVGAFLAWITRRRRTRFVAEDVAED